MRRLLPSLLILALATPAGAAVFTVTKTADTHDGACGPYDCSLREAVYEANRLPDVDVIELPAGIYILTRAGAGEDQNNKGDLDVHRPLILVGAGAGTTILDGNGADRVLDLRAQTEIFGVTLRNGGVDGPGGAVLARAAVPGYQVLIRRSVVSGNHARGSGGDGGGLMSEASGLLVVFESTLSGNRADAKGGGLAASGFQLVSSTVSGNSAGLFGGGLYFPQELSPAISGSTITANQAGQSGGGIYAQQPLFPSSVEPHIRGSIVAGNTAPDHPDCVRALSAGYNVFGAGESCSGHALDREGTEAAPLDPKLGPLAAQGGPTPVHAVLGGSPAIGLLPAGACEPADQLGQARSAPCEAGAVERLRAVCLQGGPVLCLQGGRFRVTASWSGGGTGGPATAAPLTDDTGNYWFFSPRNLELTVKVLDACEVNDRFWVFTSGLTDRGVVLEVEDLASGITWTNTHPAGTTYAPRLDTSALPCTLPADAAPAVVRGAVGLSPSSAVLVVTKLIDTLDGLCDHDCSLREAMAASNAGDEIEAIVLGPGVYTLSRPGRNEDGNATGDLDAAGRVVILGAGAGRTVIDGGSLDRVLETEIVNSSLEIHGVTIRNGRTEVPDDRDPGAGGGVNGGVLTLVGCHVTGNVSASHGGGIAGDAVTLRDTTVSNNQAELGGGIGFAQTLDLVNVTISGNQASIGGGLIVAAYDQALTNVTITGNRADQGGGLTVTYTPFPSEFPQAYFSMTRSLVAGNTAPDGPDCYGMDEYQQTYNLYGVDDGGCAHGLSDLAGTPGDPLDPKITPLGEHGGSTPTHALLAGSPAIDLGPLVGCSAMDQRGRIRPAGPGCDAGAVELHPGCQPDDTTLCLGADGRFQATARWTTRDGSGEARALPLTDDTGAFWFFNAANLELTLKVLDGCGVNDRFWVFASGLTDIGVEITVEDTRTGESWMYGRPRGIPFPTITDTDAFETCAAP